MASVLIFGRIFPILHQNALAAFFDGHFLPFGKLRIKNCRALYPSVAFLPAEVLTKEGAKAEAQFHHQFAGNGKRQRHFARPRQFADIFFGNFSVHKFV